MELLDNFFEYQNGCVVNKELGKLISYAYDLHERDFTRYSNIPTFKFVNLGAIIPNAKKIENGGIYGWRIYRDHSSDVVLTQIGVFKWENNILKSYFLETNHEDHDCSSCKAKLIEDGRYFDYDTSGGYGRNVSSGEFLEAMIMLGFPKEDVLAVATGKLTAKEVFQKVAPDSIKNIEWVDIGRRNYVFDGNVAISGNFGGIVIDKFPFPFEGQPIFDCSKVSTWYMKFGDNQRRAKLINVNANKDSIRYTDLRAAIIDEPIDLSKVDATDTIFGHQVVLYPEHSIAPLKRVNLALAVDSEGKKYATDASGHILNDWFPETEEVSIENNGKLVKVFANADNEEMARMAQEFGAEGIGLVRTENVFSSCSIDDLITFIRYYDFDNDDSLEVLRRLAKEQVEKILLVANGKRVIVRLLDFKFAEFLSLSHLSLADLDFREMPNTRGTVGLDRDILTTQVKVFMELAQQYNVELNLLIPMIDDVKNFKYFRNIIMEQAKKYSISNIRIGAMIENLHSMHYADELTRLADFISIGTNDLTESITGLSRYSQSLDFQILSEEVKKSIEEIIYRVRAVKPEIEIGVCGEHGNRIENLSFLSSLNIDYITCSSSYVKITQEVLNGVKPKEKVLQKK